MTGNSSSMFFLLGAAVHSWKGCSRFPLSFPLVTHRSAEVAGPRASPRSSAVSSRPHEPGNHPELTCFLHERLLCSLYFSPGSILVSLPDCFRMDHHDWQRGRSRGHRRYDEDDEGEETSQLEKSAVMQRTLMEFYYTQINIINV